MVLAEQNDLTEEILFRKIPWGTSATDFVSAMNKDNLGGRLQEANRLKTWELVDGKYNYLNEVENMGFKYSSSPKGASVASIPIKAIEASFLYTFDRDNVYKDENRSSLYKACYELDPVDSATTYSILVDKLTSIYGKGKKQTIADTSWSSSKGSFITKYEAMVWYGANDTGVRLYMECNVYDNPDLEKEYKCLRLEYGKTNSNELFKDITSAMSRVQTREMLSNDDVDGL